jgi:hypothetical protein
MKAETLSTSNISTDVGLKGPKHLYKFSLKRFSVVGLVTGYGLDEREVGVRVPVGSRILCSPRRPDQLLSPPNLLSNGYRVLLPRG